MNEREAYIALNMMEKIGPITVGTLVKHLGSAVAIFTADRRSLMAVQGVGPELTQAILRQRDTIDWQGECERAEKAGVRIVVQGEPDYPADLAAIHDPPLALYVKGRFEARDRHAVAVVGTRRPTYYGRSVASKLAGDLVHMGFVVVSGLAEGIDTVAHESALAAQGRTIAVLGSSLDTLYPPCNAALAERIADSGALVTELPFGRHPDRTTFPMRNRIISGLSMGVLVVEAGRESGAMITARQAVEQGRTVFAVPGRIDSPTARGTHQLLREGAVLVESVDDILREFEALFVPRKATAEAAAPPSMLCFSAEEQKLIELLEDGERDVDALIRDSNLAPATVSGLLIGLELKRLVRMLPGRKVVLLRRVHRGD
ncbi:MAG: DNA-processing protein DprA [Kiritimatiellia bacterium]